MPTVDEVFAVTPELVEAFARLVPQLSSSSPSPTAEALEAIVTADDTHLLMARDDDGTFVGTTTLVVFRIPTGVRALIEDVVVDSACAGRGISYDLGRAAIDLARRHGAKAVDLTSRPSREAANHVYRKLGFEQRETNVYRKVLETE
ncbi:MAG TPA: GNAT family N-acetyltransferase [Acidimicrobiales bacterium]|nr:GNAT family N-acetyltransferase [Acidimicrobiales bacterium]